MNERLFSQLNNKEKINFFVQCQDLLIKYHPDSEFIIRQDNLEERKSFAREFINNYKGYVYSDGNVCVLYNKILVENASNPIGAIKKYQAPHTDYNACCIDFVVFRRLLDCLSFCKNYYNPQYKFILFVRNNDVKLYHAEKLLEKLNGPFLVFP